MRAINEQSICSVCIQKCLRYMIAMLQKLFKCAANVQYQEYVNAYDVISPLFMTEMYKNAANGY